ncbi:hypothetical protein U1Q18_046029 [Sarracenia purpurea var. burkii]
MQVVHCVLGFVLFSCFGGLCLQGKGWGSKIWVLFSADIVLLVSGLGISLGLQLQQVLLGSFAKKEESPQGLAMLKYIAYFSSPVLPWSAGSLCSLFPIFLLLWMVSVGLGRPSHRSLLVLCGSFSCFSGMVCSSGFACSVGLHSVVQVCAGSFCSGALLCSDGFCVLCGAGDCLVCWEFYSFCEAFGFCVE